MIHPKFVHLCVKSDYSITTGLNKPEQLVRQSFRLNMPAIAILDYGNLYGSVKFYKSAMYYGIKPIFGVQLKLKTGFIGEELSKINVLAMNMTGYKNIIALISKAHSKKKKNVYFENEIVIYKSWLIQHKDGLIILSGGCNGDFGKYIIKKNYDIINVFLDFYNTYFFQSYYFEVHRTNRENEEKYIQYVLFLSRLKNIPIVATNDVYFIHKEDFYTHNIRLSINQGKIFNSNKINYGYSEQQYLKSTEQMYVLFSDIPEVLYNSVEIAKRCNVMISGGSYFLPNFPTGNMNIKDFLVCKSINGLKDRLILLYPNNKDRKIAFSKYKKRLLIELNIINNMNFPGYFLIVMEFIQWAKDNNIPVGPGRGSGAGSLVAYTLKITELDPISLNLFFERFLNPDRISMPDFDIDFCMENRDLVINHVINFYGQDRVSQIITFGTMSARAVIRDVGRALGYPYGFVHKISKLVPLDIGITLKKSLSFKFDLIKLYNENIEVKRLIDIAKKLEGVIRNIGKHAGGVVISPVSLINFMPIQLDDNGMFITQFDKNDIDYIGLLKFDFLGLRTLTIINSTLKMINIFLKQNKKDPINLNLIPLDDKKSFKLLKTAETIAVFQLESYGMRNLIIKLQPDCFDDIISLIALFRPGPLKSGMVNNFINRKKGREPISYPDIKWQHNSLRKILQSTYGIILYQEQVMQIAQKLSNYSLSQADILQRAMSKKQPKEMLKQRDIFNKGAKKNGISCKLSSKIFDILEKFSGYGFNKSHSAAYALISYQTLWMKANYPAEFMASVMNSDIDNTDKITTLVQECLRMKLNIIHPNVNISKYFFTVDRNKNIIYGLGAIKGLGKSVIKTIISAREKIKFFQELFDFCIHVNFKFINKRVLEKLIFSGSFDTFKISRYKLIHLIPTCINLARQYKNSNYSHQLSLFQNIENDRNIFLNFKIKKKNIVWSKKNQLDYEKDVLGFYLTDNPLTEYLYELKKYTNGIRIKNLHMYKDYQLIKIFGIVSFFRFKITKGNKKIVFLELIDDIYKIEVIVFDKFINSFIQTIKKHDILIVTGYILSKSFNNKKFIAKNIINITESRNKYVKKIFLFIKKNIDINLIYKIKKIFLPYLGGSIRVVLKLMNISENFNIQLNDSWNVKLDEKLINKIKQLLGKDSLCLIF